MLYTGKGDDGTTKVFGCDQRISKSSAITEALGAVDETNSFLGICKVKSARDNLMFGGKKISDIAGNVQQTLFIIQAELAGADKTVADEKVSGLEMLIADIEKVLPPIKNFSVSGGTELSANFDFVRTLVRRAERRVVRVREEGGQKVAENTAKYLNRLSSLFFALARLCNHLSGINEDSPSYK